MAYLTDEEIDQRILAQGQTFDRQPASGGLAQIGQATNIRRPAWMPPEVTGVPKSTERTLGGTLADVGVSLGKGVVGTGQAAIGLADMVTPGQLGKGLENVGVDLGTAQDYLSEKYSPAQQAAFKKVEDVKGFLPTLGAMVENPSTIVHSVVESLPAIAGGGLVGRGALALAPKIGGLAAGAIGEGAVTAGQTAEGIRAQADDREITGKQSLMALGAGAGTGLIGGLSGKIAGGIARKLGINLADVDTFAATGKLGDAAKKLSEKGKFTDNVAARIVAGGVSEGVFEELPQSIQEQVWMNAATGKDLKEGLGEAAAAGLLAGTAMGGGMNVFTGGDREKTNTDQNISQEEQDLANVQTQIQEIIAGYDQTKPEETIDKLNELYQQEKDLKNKRIEDSSEIPLPKDIDEINRQIANLEAVENPNRGTVELLSQLKQHKENLPSIIAQQRMHEQRADQQGLYENLFGPDQQVMADAIGTAQASAQTFEQAPTEVLAARRRQREIDQTYLPAEEEANRIAEYRANEAEQIENARILREQELSKAEQNARISDMRKTLFGPTPELSEAAYRELYQAGELQERQRQKQVKELKVLNENKQYQNMLKEELKEIFPENSDRVMQRLLEEEYAEQPTEQEIEATKRIQEFENRTGKRLPNTEILLDVKIPQTTIPILDPASGERIYLSDRGLQEEQKQYDPFESITQRLGGKVFPRPQDISPEAIRQTTTQPDVTPVMEQTEQTEEELGRVEEATIAPEEPTVEETPTIEPEQVIQDQDAIREDFQAREALIADMEDELEENKIEQSQLGVNDPMREELQYRAEELQGQIQDGNRELLVDRLSAGPDAQFETRSDTEPGQGIALPEIQKMYKGQDVFQSEDGTVSVRFKNGSGATIQNIQDAGNGFVQMAIDTGQMSKNGKILGVTTGNNILLDSEFADNATLWHENKHVLDNLGMITEKDNSLLNKEFNKLRKVGKLNFGLSTHEDPRLAMEENRANMFAQIMVDREAYRDTTLSKVIQRVMDFFKNLFSLGQQTVSGLAREVESGKIYERETGKNQIEQDIMFEVAGNTESNEFKNWFKDSKVVDKKGDPLVVYHGTDVEITSFDPEKLGENTGAESAKNAFFFTGRKKTADYYSKGKHANKQEAKITAKNEGTKGPNIVSVYLSMQNPLIYDFKGKAYREQTYADLIKKAKENGHDGVIFKRTFDRGGYGKFDLFMKGQFFSEDIYAVFDPGQIKSNNNKGTFDPTNPDIRFETRELKDENWDKKYPKINFEVRERLGIPEQTISEADYVKNRKQHKDLVDRTKQALKSTGRSLNRTLNKYLGVTSTNLLKIHPMLQAKAKRLDFDTIKRIQSNIAIATPVLEKMSKMSKNDQTDFDWAVKNGDFGKIMSLAQSYDFIPQYQALRDMMDTIHKNLKDVGYRPGYVENYWPRAIKDYEGFLLATQEISQEPIFTKALEQQAKKLGTTVADLSPDMRANIISQKIQDVKAGIGGPGNIHQRVYEKIPLDLGKYYAGASASLVNYIYSTAKNIEGRKFFGKVPTKIKNARQIIFDKTNEIKTLEARKAELVAANQDTTEIEEQIASKQDYIEDHQKKLEEYGQTGEFKDDIGSYVDELMVAKVIKPEDEKTLKDILEARFYEHGTTGKANVFKNLSLIDTMGSPLSAITQIQDLGFSVYVGGLTPRGITNSVKNIGKALAKRSDIKKEDLGLEWIAQEFADPDTLSRAVNKIFKLTKLDRMDTIGKEVLVNNSYDNYRVKAKNKAKLFKEIRHMFSSDKETNQVIEDLRNNVKDSNDVQFLVFSRLLDFQPATKSEMAEKALTAGNWRLAYLLKSFTIKQIDVFRRDVWHKLKEGTKNNDKALIAEGMKNMGMLLGLLSVAGAGADELKDLILGKDIDFEDHFIEQLASLGGANRYLRMQVRKEGVGTALGKQILPPFKFIDAITKDTAQNTWDLDSARWVDSIPLVGKIYSWRMGRAAQYRSSVEEKDFTNDSKEFKSFNKEFEESNDKRLFLQTNLETFKQKKLYDNFNKALRGNKATIAKLKDIEQTTNVRKRLSQLEQQRKTLINKYFEMKNNI